MSMLLATILGGLAVLLALGWKVWQARQADTPSSSGAVAPTATVYDDAEVRQLLASGQKLEAIKRYKERFRTGLKEAKEAVDALEAGAVPTRASFAAPAPATVSDADTDPEIRRLLAANRLIEAIKRYKDLTGVGLKEAKEAVEQLQQRQ